MPLPILLLALGAGAAPCVVPGPQEEPDPQRFERVEYAGELRDPVDLAVLPDGRVLVAERDGSLWIAPPGARALQSAGGVEVFEGEGDGLHALATPPAADSSGPIFLLRSSPVFRGAELVEARLRGDVLDPSSERVLFAFEQRREVPGHRGGALAFASDGALFVATGDDTDPTAAIAGTAPLDPAAGRAALDALTTSANPNSASGKILRLRPRSDGTYLVPEGNLYPAASTDALPEVFALGLRDPWCLTVDPASGALYVADLGPRAAPGEAVEGPAPADEVHRLVAPGNLGWPQFLADNRPYRSWTEAGPGVPFDPTRPRVQLPGESSPRDLPAAESAWIHVGDAPSRAFPGLGGDDGRRLGVGAVYAFDEALESPVKFPRWFDEGLLLFDAERGGVWIARADRSGGVRSLRPLPGSPGRMRATALAFGPEGALYALERSAATGEARLVRYEYWRGNRPPQAVITALRAVGAAPLQAELAAGASRDADGDALTHRWTLATDAGPVLLGEGERLVHEFPEVGLYRVQLESRDAGGLVGRAAVRVAVGNEPPRVELLSPREGDLFVPGEPLRWWARVVDREDGDSEAEDADPAYWAERIVVALQSEDARPPTAEALQGRGPVGRFEPGSLAPLPTAGRLELTARYEDDGGGIDVDPVGRLTGTARVGLRTPLLELEHFAPAGASVGRAPEASGGAYLTGLTVGQRLALGGFRLGRVEGVRLRSATPAAARLALVVRGDARRLALLELDAAPPESSGDGASKAPAWREVDARLDRALRALHSDGLVELELVLEALEPGPAGEPLEAPSLDRLELLLGPG